MKGISLGAKPQAKEDISSFKKFKFSFFGVFGVFYVVYFSFRFFVFASVISVFRFSAFLRRYFIFFFGGNQPNAQVLAFATESRRTETASKLSVR